MVARQPIPLEKSPGGPPRYTRDPLPAYRHVPDLTPHPVKDPGGHLFGVEDPQHSRVCSSLPDAWSQCTEYMYGADLFNQAYLWEAHETWELVWIGAGKSTEPARFIQGLIQIAAALLRQHLGTPRGAHNLLLRAQKSVEPALRAMLARGDTFYMGIPVESWLCSVEEYLAQVDRPYPFLRLRV